MLKEAIFDAFDERVLFLNTSIKSLVQRHWAETFQLVFSLGNLGAVLLFQCAKRE